MKMVENGLCYICNVIILIKVFGLVLNVIKIFGIYMYI